MKAAALEVTDVLYVEEATREQVKRAPAPVRVIPVAPRQEISALDYCLNIWQQWQRCDDTALGFRRRCAVLESDYDEDIVGDSDALFSSMDRRVGEAVDAMISSLTKDERELIYMKYEVRRAWRFPNLDQTQALAEALGALEMRLRKNLATRGFFL